MNASPRPGDPVPSHTTVTSTARVLWGDTVLASMVAVVLCALPFTAWLHAVDQGAPQDHGDPALAEGLRAVSGPGDHGDPTAWPWIWVLGSVASAVVALALLRRFRSR